MIKSIKSFSWSGTSKNYFLSVIMIYYIIRKHLSILFILDFNMYVCIDNIEVIILM